MTVKVRWYGLQVAIRWDEAVHYPGRGERLQGPLQARQCLRFCWIRQVHVRTCLGRVVLVLLLNLTSASSKMPPLCIKNTNFHARAYRESWAPLVPLSAYNVLATCRLLRSEREDGPPPRNREHEGPTQRHPTTIWCNQTWIGSMADIARR